MRRAILAALCLAFLAPSGQSQTPSAQGDVTFRFQSNFWVNLHHFVRAEARRRAVGTPALLPLTDLGEKEQTAWTAALDAYADLAKLNLIFDQPLISINDALAVAGNRPTLAPGTIEPRINAALNAAAPIYRAHIWERRRRENEGWIETYRPLIDQHATAVIRALAAAYHVDWPRGTILVDLSCDSGPNEAYTTGRPAGMVGHTVIAPLKLNERDKAFEIVFHEASHVVDDQITKALEREAAKQQVKIPRDLWHALIFYTSGELARRELGKENDPAYQPYGKRVGIYKNVGGGKSLAALERDWQPYLDGKKSFDAASRDLVKDGP